MKLFEYNGSVTTLTTEPTLDSFGQFTLTGSTGAYQANDNDQAIWIATATDFNTFKNTHPDAPYPPHKPK